MSANASKFDGINVYWGKKVVDGEDVVVVNAFYLKGRMADVREQYGLPVWTKGTRYTLKHMASLKRMIADYKMQRRKAENGPYYQYVLPEDNAVLPLFDEAGAPPFPFK